MQFEWDENKEKINISKHGIKFTTALRVFYDDMHIEVYDEIHSLYEDRYLAIGMVDDVALILTVVFTERGDIIRIISARAATKQEKEAYYNDGKKKH